VKVGPTREVIYGALWELYQRKGFEALRAAVVPGTAAAMWEALDHGPGDTPSMDYYGLDGYFSEPDVPERNIRLASQLHWPAVPDYCEERR
jgi:hypothetical protein